MGISVLLRCSYVKNLLVAPLCQAVIGNDSFLTLKIKKKKVHACTHMSIKVLLGILLRKY